MVGLQPRRKLGQQQEELAGGPSSQLPSLSQAAAAGEQLGEARASVSAAPGFTPFHHKRPQWVIGTRQTPSEQQQPGSMFLAHAGGGQEGPRSAACPAHAATPPAVPPHLPKEAHPLLCSV